MSVYKLNPDVTFSFSFSFFFSFYFLHVMNRLSTLPLGHKGCTKQKARDPAMKPLGEDGTKVFGNIF
jgi:hypothetical protein